jgi:hypothetical protein
MLKKLLLVLICCATSCSGGQTNTTLLYSQSQYDRIKIKNFWGWFVREKLLFETMTDANRDERLNLILEHLAPISDGLALEVSKEFHGVRDIIISADGDKSKFPIVQEIVKGAPKISGWTVTAFRQKANEDFVLTYENFRLSPSEMSFRPFIDGDSLDLLIYADSIGSKNQEDVVKYGLIAMDNVIGEYAATLKVRSFEFKDKREIAKGEKVYNLDKLPKFVDAFYADRHSLAKKSKP